jgi:tetratricopeptide (TPR) repeat protein
MTDEEFHNQFERLKRATEEHPQDGQAWSAFGDFLCNESQNPCLAVRAYERAQELLPHQDMRLRLGRAYTLVGKAEEGIALIEACAEQHRSPEGYCFLSDAYARNGRRAEAEEAARAAIRADPAFEEGYYLLGEALKDHDRAAAINAYRTAISLDGNYALAWQALGRELGSCGDKEGSVRALKKAVELDSTDVWSHVLLANVLWTGGHIREADQEYRIALRLAPEWEDIRRWHAEFLEQTGGGC